MSKFTCRFGNPLKLLLVFVLTVGATIYLLKTFSKASATSPDTTWLPQHFNVSTISLNPVTATYKAHPIAMAVHPETNDVYLAATGSREIVLIDGIDIADRIPLTPSIYKACLPENRPSSGIYCLTDVSVHPVTGFIYATQWQTDKVFVISGTEVIDSFIGTPRWNGPAMVAASPVTSAAYVGAIWSTNHIGFVCGQDAVAEFEIDGLSDVVDLAVSSQNGKDIVYAVEQGADQLLIVENQGSCEEPDVISKTVTVGDAPTSIAVHPDNGLAYVVNSGSGDVSIVSDDQVIATVPIGSGGWPVLGPSSFDGYVVNGSTEIIAISPQTGEVYVANWVDGTVTVIQQTDEIKTIEVGNNPNSLIVNPRSGLIYVANIGDNSVSVIEGHVVLTTFTVSAYPIAMEVVPDHGTIYIAGRDADEVTIIREPYRIFLPVILN